MGFAYEERNIMRKSSGEPKSIEAEIESSNSEERGQEQGQEEEQRPQTEGLELPQGKEPFQDAAASTEAAQSDDWWTASPQTGDWGDPATSDQTEIGRASCRERV